MCGTRNETISQVNVANLLKRSTDSIGRHDSVGRYVLWEFCEKLGFNRPRLSYEHEPKSVVQNEYCKILRDFTIQCDHIIEAGRPDIVVKRKRSL